MSVNRTTDQIVIGHWCHVLSVDDASDSDNFFADGGNSLLAVDLAQRLEEEFGGEFPLDVLFVEGTLASVKAAAAGLASAG